VHGDRSAARLSALAIAVAKSSVKEARPDSVSGNGCSLDREPTIMTPRAVKLRALWWDC
jgi:hypothetical protein